MLATEESVVLNPEGSVVGSWKAIFKQGIKDKPIRAKRMSDVFRDQSVFTKFLIKTLEGNQDIQPKSMMCLGAIDDPWQQDIDKIKKKYDFDTVDETGWIVFTPKPDVVTNVFQVTQEMLGDSDKFQIVGLWGTEGEDGKMYQTGKVGDWVANIPDDPADVYIIEQKVFAATYSVKD